jgi:hypothetical protein
MSSYESLEATIDLIVDAAIESEMYLNGYEGTVSEGFTHQGPYVHVTGPNQSGRRGYGGVATDGFGYPVEFTPPWNIGADVYNAWDEAIHSAFEGWTELPDPGGFESLTERTRDAAATLTDGSLATEKYGITGGNTELGDIGTMNTELAQFNGATINAFTRNYSNRLPVIVRGQSAIAAMLWFGVAGEREIWTSARLDVADVADKVLAAMKAARGGGGGDFSTALKVGGAIASIAGKFVPGPAGTIVSVAGTGASALGGLIPKPKPPKWTTLPFGGATPSDVLSKLRDGLQKLNETIADQESQIADMLSEAHSVVQAEEESFNLAAPLRLLNETDQGNLITADETKVKIQTLRWIGRSVMPNIAAQLDKAKGRIAGGSGSGPWTRPANIGYGSDGPFWSWSSLEEHLESLLVDTAWEVRSAGHHLVIAADDFEATDAEAHRDLAAHSRELRDGSPAADHDPPPQPRPIGGHPVPY